MSIRLLSSSSNACYYKPIEQLFPKISSIELAYELVEVKLEIFF